MLLSEIFGRRRVTEGDSSSLQVKVTAVLSQIQSEVESDDYKMPYTPTALLRRLSQSGVSITPAQLKDAIDSEPWSNFISDIKNDRVVFLGDPEASSHDSPNPEMNDDSVEQSSSMLDKMAKRAAKRQQ